MIKQMGHEAARAPAAWTVAEDMKNANVPCPSLPAALASRAAVQ